MENVSPERGTWGGDEVWPRRIYMRRRGLRRGVICKNGPFRETDIDAFGIV